MRGASNSHDYSTRKMRNLLRSFHPDGVDGQKNSDVLISVFFHGIWQIFVKLFINLLDTHLKKMMEQLDVKGITNVSTLCRLCY